MTEQKVTKARGEKKYQATLIGNDGFSLNMVITTPLPVIYIPVRPSLNAYFEATMVYDTPKKREFLLNRDKSYKNNLVYEENL